MCTFYEDSNILKTKCSQVIQLVDERYKMPRTKHQW